MKILSCGAGMQSTALALMSCANKLILEGRAFKLNTELNPQVPIYDAIIFCDLGLEPDWVQNQVLFIQSACEYAGIPFYILNSNLYKDYMERYGMRRVVSIPFWSVDDTGKKGKLPRNCTLDYKIDLIIKFVKWNLLGYKKGQKTRPEDIKAHELHIGFSKEEEHRCKPNPNPLFTNSFPLVEMGLTRADNYKYILEVWGLDTKASACCFCPFHTNYFFNHLKENNAETYQKTVAFDDMLAERKPDTIKSDIYISKSRKRIRDLQPEDCTDCETFLYNGQPLWNGF